MGECKNCKKEIKGRGSKYCSNSCQGQYQSSLKLNDWLNGKNTFIKGGVTVPGWMRRYLINESKNQCSSCGWSVVNEHTGKTPLEIDHIDGDAYNNAKENLRVLCPNCHSLTKTYKNTGSRKSTRTYRNK